MVALVAKDAKLTTVARYTDSSKNTEVLMTDTGVDWRVDYHAPPPPLDGGLACGSF